MCTLTHALYFQRRGNEPSYTLHVNMQTITIFGSVCLSVCFSCGKGGCWGGVHESVFLKSPHQRDRSLYLLLSVFSLPNPSRVALSFLWFPSLSVTILAHNYTSAASGENLCGFLKIGLFYKLAQMSYRRNCPLCFPNEFRYRVGGLAGERSVCAQPAPP